MKTLKTVMDDFKIQPIPDVIKSSYIEKIGDEKENKKDKKDFEQQSNGLLAFVRTCQSMKKILDNISIKQKKGSIKKLLSSIAELEKSLKKLQEHDLSEDAKFLKELSLNWLHFLREFAPFLNQEDPLSLEIKRFLNEIHAYPSGSEFSLGYYLSKFAGLEWIPFPYMEILKDLHNNFKDKKEESLLLKWINELNSLIVSKE